MLATSTSPSSSCAFAKAAGSLTPSSRASRYCIASGSVQGHPNGASGPATHPKWPPYGVTTSKQFGFACMQNFSKLVDLGKLSYASTSAKSHAYIWKLEMYDTGTHIVSVLGLVMIVGVCLPYKRFLLFHISLKAMYRRFCTDSRNPFCNQLMT